MKIQYQKCLLLSFWELFFVCPLSCVFFVNLLLVCKVAGLLLTRMSNFELCCIIHLGAEKRLLLELTYMCTNFNWNNYILCKRNFHLDWALKVVYLRILSRYLTTFSLSKQWLHVSHLNGFWLLFNRDSIN
jgi:hypothetical protein